MTTTDLPTLEAALKLADQDCPLPSLAGPALKVLRAEIESLRGAPMTWPRCTGNPAGCPENNGSGCCNHYGSGTLTALTAELRELHEAMDSHVHTSSAPVSAWLESLDALLYSLAEERTGGDTVSMPLKLTADNGAKAALMSEFHVEVKVPNPTPDVLEGSGDQGAYFNTYPVSWTTIKAIYAAAVRHFHPELP